MSAQYRHVKITLSVVPWGGVLIVATYWPPTAVVFGQYSWGRLILLGFLVWIAMMADHLANDIVSYWNKQSPTTTVVRQREWWMSRIGLRTTKIKAFGRGLPSCFVNVVMSCKRVSRGLMSSVPYP
jgi:hypothetical protein